MANEQGIAEWPTPDGQAQEVTVGQVIKPVNEENKLQSRGSMGSTSVHLASNLRSVKTRQSKHKSIASGDIIHGSGVWKEQASEAQRSFEQRQKGFLGKKKREKLSELKSKEGH